MRYDDDRIEKLERLVEDLAERVSRLESARAAEPPRLTAPPAPPPPSPPSTEAEGGWKPWVWPDEKGQPARERVASAPRPGLDFEDILGRRVLAWVGSVAVVLGVAFFFAMAVRRGWIDETTRVVLAYFGSTALLAIGLYLYERQGRTQAALATVATAIAALYASTTAATALYEVVEPAIGLGIAGLIGAAATAIAVRWNSPIVGGVGIVGALLAPVLVDAGTSGVALAFMAIALVAATAVLVWRRWDWLAIAAFVVSAPQLISWVVAHHDDALVLTLVVTALFWAVYVVAAAGYELRVPSERLRFSSASLLLTNALLVTGMGWAVLEAREHGDAGTSWVIGAAVVHVVLGSLSLRGRISREIALLSLAIGVGLTAIAVALALDGPAVVAAWSVEAVVLTWLGRRLGVARAYIASGVFLLLALVHTLVVDAHPGHLVDTDWRAIVAVALVACASFASARLYAGRWREPRVLADALGVAAVAYLVPIALEDVAVVVAWAALGVALALLGPRGYVGELGVAAPAFVALAALHTLVLEAPPDALRGGVDSLPSAALAILAVGAAALACARLVDWPREVERSLEVVGAGAAVYLPSVAIVDVTATGGPLEPGQTPQVLLSAFWSVTGVAALVYGLMRDDRRFRIGGLTLLGIAVAKVYLYDLGALDEIYRVLSFIALGLLLLAGAFAYQRIRHTVEERE